MATDESFLAAANPNGQTVTRKPDHANTENGGCIGGCISGVSGAIGRQKDATTDATTEAILAESAGEKPVFIVEDSNGGFWLMGVEGLEPPTLSV